MHEPWVPVRCCDVDLAADAEPAGWFGAGTAGSSAGPLLVLARLHTRVLTVVSLPRAGSHVDLVAQVAAVSRDEVAAHSATWGCAPEDADPPCLQERVRLLTGRPSVSVVIATRERPDELAACLESVLAQEVVPDEIVVVDNAPATDRTRRLVSEFADRGVRYVLEPRAGLANAHNAGLAAAVHEIVAITDDDVLVDRYWVAALLEAFAGAADIGCVTGLILPVELRTREQSWVEEYGGFARGFRMRSSSLATPPSDQPLFPFAAGRLGSGANMAFRRSALEAIGGFDGALGAGTKARGGDDLAAFAEVVLAGATLVYQPDAVVRHRHRSDLESVRRMATGYGVGLGAYLTSLAVRRPSVVPAMCRRAPGAVRHLLGRRSTKNSGISTDYPRELVWAERRGVIAGPFSYFASRRSLRAGGH